MQTLRPSAVVIDDAHVKAKTLGITVADVISACEGDWFKNDVYTVTVRDLGEERGVHLSIRRNDRKPIHDWRDLQEIKNQLLGPECEAVELYPAESRLVDAANTYHLWGYRDPAWRFPLGFFERMVGTAEQAAAVGGQQRPLGAPLAPVVACQPARPCPTCGRP